MLGTDFRHFAGQPTRCPVHRLVLMKGPLVARSVRQLPNAHISDISPAQALPFPSLQPNRLPGGIAGENMAHFEPLCFRSTLTAPSLPAYVLLVKQTICPSEKIGVHLPE